MVMRALCGAIITAGALIGLGLTAIGIGARYHSFAEMDQQGNVRWLTFKSLDTPLALILTLLIIVLFVGIAVAFLGLAFHHHRRHFEHLRNTQLADTGARLGV
jgi:cell division protein FtsX